MLMKKATNRKWGPTEFPGIERSLFRTNDTGGRSSIVRLLNGSHYPLYYQQRVIDIIDMLPKYLQRVDGPLYEDGSSDA